MPIESVPHDSWAGIYDLIYNRAFGPYYKSLTEATINLITKQVASGSKIIDYGAGTGRLSLPLAAADYRVTAVDLSSAMLGVLSSLDHHSKIKIINSSIRDFESLDIFDFAICVFTVISYITTKDELIKSFEAIYRSLKPGGKLLLDIPSAILFRDELFRSAEFDRTVTIKPRTEDQFTFYQIIRWNSSNGIQVLEDEFPLRYWKEELVSEILTDIGFIKKKDLTNLFRETGSKYWMLTRGS